MSAKTTGGIDLLDKSDRISKIDSEVSEAMEPLNLRTSDVLDLALGEITKKNPGGYIADKQYSTPVAYSSIPEDTTFDRYYFELSLLVDFKQKPTSEAGFAELNKEIKEKKAFARKQGLRYLAILGSATYEEIAAALS
jgi:hypothetical protein